ncbi:hypothetical protein, partial [Paenibacillus cisolokensis]|uniref:hypothetical protein n=1 Tax=Paenibacillus cisolokensis TaxID=1658519 RepID=UPI001BCDDA1B
MSTRTAGGRDRPLFASRPSGRNSTAWLAISSAAKRAGSSAVLGTAERAKLHGLTGDFVRG